MTNLKTTKRKGLIKEEDEDEITSTPGILSPEQKATMRGMLYDAKESLLKIEKYAGVELGDDNLVKRITEIENRVSSLLTDIQSNSFSEDEDDENDSRIDLDARNEDPGQHVIEARGFKKKMLKKGDEKTVRIDVSKECEELRNKDGMLNENRLHKFCNKLESYYDKVKKSLGINEALNYGELVQELAFSDDMQELNEQLIKLYDFADDNNIIIKTTH